MQTQEILMLILGNAAFIVPLFLWNRSESRADIRHMDAKIEYHWKETQALISAIRQDMHDFHIRLEKLDAEFKGKMALQDAEFKAHIMYCNEERGKK
jgi:hypothetical protein